MNIIKQKLRNVPAAPASYFAMTLGLAETGNALRLAGPSWELPLWCGELFEGAAVLSWGWWLLLYINKWISHRQTALQEWRDPVQSSFIALLPESMILIALVCDPYHAETARALFWVGSAANLIYAAYRVSSTWTLPRSGSQITPSLLLPFSASVLVNALAAGLLGYETYGRMVFGVGVISWLILDSVLLQQLMNGGLEVKVRNVMGIYMAPAAIALVAYQVLGGGSSDLVTLALAGYSLFQIVALLLSYRWLRKQAFAPGYWAYTFGVATVAQGYLLMTQPHTTLGYVAAALLSASVVLTLLVTVGTFSLMRSGTYFPVVSPHKAA
ncbi:hypothetical protein [Paenibacillus sp.]|uniref:SLAC1 family transporter n=1 Tax=Paenibacillus sp. TaxID=58172 RepID=UPI002811EBAD|nr:hypothetical protein [Paenibacillus sp.]